VTAERSERVERVESAGSASLSSMIAVVTGASGFIGSHLVDALVAKGATVRVIRRVGSTVSGARPLAVGAVPFECDLLDAASVRDSAVWDGATHCFHLAGVTKATRHGDFNAGNVASTETICRAIGHLRHPEVRLVLVSSQAAAGPASSATAPVTEEDAPRPIEAYGQSKRAAELTVERWREQFGTTIVRPAAVYGPRDWDFLEAFRQATSRVAFYAASRSQRFSLVHVGDVVAGLIRAATARAAVGRTYFLGADPPVSWEELYAEISRAARQSPVGVQVPRVALQIAAALADATAGLTGRAQLLNRHKVALAGPSWWICDSSRARRELEWAPRTSLVEGVGETLTWYRDNGWLNSAGRAKR